MDNKKLNTTYDFPLEDGTTVKLTLNFYYLYQLRSKYGELYKRYNTIMQTTNKNDIDILDMVTICYVGYVCANQNEETILTEDEFYLLCGSDMNVIGKAVNHLINQKKTKVSEARSN